MANYIGEKEVKGFVESGKNTPGGSPMVVVDFTDGSKEIMSHTRYMAIVSDQPLDASALREKFAKRVASIIYGALHEYDTKLSEVDFVLDNVATLVNNAIEKASNYKFGVEFSDQRTLIMINDVLLEANKDGLASAGSGSDSSDKK